jgi:hypothetical protein
MPHACRSGDCIEPSRNLGRPAWIEVSDFPKPHFGEGSQNCFGTGSPSYVGKHTRWKMTNCPPHCGRHIAGVVVL